LKAPLKGLVIDGSVIISGYPNLVMGTDVSIHHHSYISAEGGLTIGNNVSIGHRCSILTTEHAYADKSTAIKFQPVIGKPVHISDNVWLGANVTILAGVSLEPGTVVAAGAVVTKSFEERNIVIGGVPARILKRY
jgi:acetyltransferase-like isoleucine patch superfamily enzyme